MITYPEYRELFLHKIYQFFIPQSKLLEESEVKRQIDSLADSKIKFDRKYSIEGEEESYEEDLGATVAYSDSVVSRSAVYNRESSEGMKVRG